jgi:hypothetical protein
MLISHKDRGRDDGQVAPPSEPDWQISRIRLSSWWLTFSQQDRQAAMCACLKENKPIAEK